MKYLLVALVVLGLVFGGFWWRQTKNTQSEEVVLEQGEEAVVFNEKIKASFLIFTNGVKREFTSVMYLNRSDKAYMVSDMPNVVIVSEPNVTWNDFFMSLPFSLNANCLTTGLGQLYCDGDGGELKFFVNERENERMLETPIRNGDRVLVTFGKSSQEEIEKQLSLVPKL